MKGILLIATGANVYARWATNMALSLKYNDPTLLVCLVTDEKIKAMVKPVLFDHIKIAEHEHMHTRAGDFAPGKLKLHMYDYSPFDETIYLDVDGLTLKSLAGLFDKCKGRKLATQVMSVTDQTAEKWPCQWMSLKTVRVVYKLPDRFVLPELNSSFWYFEKSDEAARYFAKAKECYLDGYKTHWGNSFPDELAFNVAGALCDVDLRMNKTKDDPVLFVAKNYKLSEDTYVLGVYGGYNVKYRMTYTLYESLLKKYSNGHSVGELQGLMTRKFVLKGAKLKGKEFDVPARVE